MLALHLPLADFVAAWGFLAMNVVSPGPNVLNTISLAIGSGRRAALGAALGTGLAVTVWCLGMALGMAALLAAVPLARTAMTLVAVGLLVWFATRYLRNGWAGLRAGAQPQAPAARRGARARDGLMRALGVMMTNPKALTTWLTMTAIFPVARAGAGDIALLTLGACVVAGTIHAGYAVAFSTPTAARAYLRAAPVVNIGVGLFFAAFAITLARGLWVGMPGP